MSEHNPYDGSTPESDDARRSLLQYLHIENFVLLAPLVVGLVVFAVVAIGWWWVTS